MEATECVHWWDLPESNGPVSVGMCRYCGETKEFRNSEAPTSHFRVAGAVGLARKKRADGGDHYPGGYRVLGPKGE